MAESASSAKHLCSWNSGHRPPTPNAKQGKQWKALHPKAWSNWAICHVKEFEECKQNCRKIIKNHQKSLDTGSTLRAPAASPRLVILHTKHIGDPTAYWYPAPAVQKAISGIVWHPRFGHQILPWGRVTLRHSSWYQSLVTHMACLVHTAKIESTTFLRRASGPPQYLWALKFEGNLGFHMFSYAFMHGSCAASLRIESRCSLMRSKLHFSNSIRVRKNVNAMIRSPVEWKCHRQINYQFEGCLIFRLWPTGRCRSRMWNRMPWAARAGARLRQHRMRWDVAHCSCHCSGHGFASHGPVPQQSRGKTQ